MKILYVTTISNTINAFLVPHIEMLINQGYSVDVACNVKRPIKKELIDLGVNIFQVDFNRSPITKDNYSAYKHIKKLIIKNKYEIIHTHTPIASAITRLACKSLNVKMFYTAHGFHFYKGAPLKNWLFYYPVERWLSRYTDTLITINQEDYIQAKKFKKTNAIYVPGVGIDLEKIRNIKVDKDKKRDELNLPKNSFVMTSVGELSKRKNHEVVIRALGKIRNNNIHYAICGQGDLERELKELTLSLGLEKQVHFLGFRDDITEINKASDLFLFPSHQEGLPVGLMEAMAAGLPIVASNIRGNEDLIEKKGGKLLSPNNIDDWAESIKRMYNNSKETNNRMGNYNKNQVKRYELNNVLDRMESIYK